MHLCGIHQISRGGISLNIGPDFDFVFNDACNYLHAWLVFIHEALRSVRLVRVILVILCKYP